MKKLLEKAFKENNYKLLEKENLNQIPHQIIIISIIIYIYLKIIKILIK